MTDKIIIDGVDVSGCDFLAKEDVYSSYSGEYQAYKGECGCSENEMCKDHKNCGYKKLAKQLFRKTEECEKLKKDLDTANINYANEMDYQKMYKQTLKEIKEYIDKTVFKMSQFKF